MIFDSSKFYTKLNTNPVLDGKQFVVVYHGKDLDGFSSGFFCKHFCNTEYNQDPVMIPADYSDDEKVKEQLISLSATSENPLFVFFVDFTLSVESLKAILDNNVTFVICDHHHGRVHEIIDSGVLNHPNAYCVLNLENTYAGVFCTWFYLKLKQTKDIFNKCSQIVDLISRYDRFDFDRKYPDARIFNSGVLSICNSKDFTDVNWFSLLNDDNIPRFMERGQFIYNKQVEQNKQRAVHSVEANIYGHSCICINEISSSSLFEDGIEDCLAKYEHMIFFEYYGEVSGWKMTVVSNNPEKRSSLDFFEDLKAELGPKVKNSGGHLSIGGAVVESLPKDLAKVLGF